MTPEERAVIDAAQKWRHGPMGEREGHLGKLLLNAVDVLEEALAPASEELIWVARTMADVREGDVVRLPAAPDLHARVEFVQPLDWHVKEGRRSWQYNGNTYWDDVPLEHRRVSVRLEYAGAKLDHAGRPVLMELPAETPVEIHLTATELRAIELLGWDNRARVDSEGSNAAE